MNSQILESRFVSIDAPSTVVHQNEVTLRQGEWFFVPAPRLAVDAKRIRRHEPICRSGEKAHTVEEIFHAMHAHPTLPEAFQEASLDAWHRAIHK